ncbi:hypothetical protein BDV12DRAFT_194948 [Aspergillus spectabilis]
MYKLLPFALAAYAAVAAPQDEVTTTSAVIGDTFPAEPTVISTTIADSFPKGPSTTSVIADPSTTFGDPSILSTIIADPTWGPGPSSTSSHTPGGSWTTSIIIADPTPAPGAPGSGDEPDSPTNPVDPQFTGAASSLDIPLYAIAGILAGVAMI